MEQNKFMNKIEWVDKREPLSDRQKELLMFVFSDSLAPQQQTVLDKLAEEISQMSDAEFNKGVDELMKFVKPQQTEVSAEEFYLSKIRALHPSVAVVSLKGELITAQQAVIWTEEYHSQPVKFTPERTAKEEADEIYDEMGGIVKSIDLMEYNIKALKARSLDTTFEEEVLTILKGM